MPDLWVALQCGHRKTQNKKNKYEQSCCSVNKAADVVLGSLLPAVAAQLPAGPHAADSCTFCTQRKKVHSDLRVVPVQ